MKVVTWFFLYIYTWYCAPLFSLVARPTTVCLDFAMSTVCCNKLNALNAVDGPTAVNRCKVDNGVSNTFSTAEQASAEFAILLQQI